MFPVRSGVDIRGRDSMVGAGRGLFEGLDAAVGGLRKVVMRSVIPVMSFMHMVDTSIQAEEFEGRSMSLKIAFLRSGKSEAISDDSQEAKVCSFQYETRKPT